MAPTLTGPRRFAEYELLEELGQGGMGTVYRARLIPTPIVVALKLIRPGGLDGAEAVRRFHEEVETAAGLRHPNIVRIYHVGGHDGQPFYTMALVEKGSLDRHMGRFQGDLQEDREIARPGGPCRPPRASASDPAPRSQAGQHPARRGLDAPRRRFWPGRPPRRGRHYSGRGIADRFAELDGPRGSSWRRSAQYGRGHLGVGRHPLRTAYREASVSWGGPADCSGGDPRAGTCSAP